MRLWGSVQIDGKYVGGHIKPENKKKDRKDRHLKENQNGKRVCVMDVREHNRHGPNRTFTRVVPDEKCKAAWVAVPDRVERGARMIADEHTSYDDLRGLAEHYRVNHNEAYETDKGINTNSAESSFSRVERSYVGINHRFSMKYVDWVWRWSRRRRTPATSACNGSSRTSCEP